MLQARRHRVSFWIQGISGQSQRHNAPLTPGKHGVRVAGGVRLAKGDRVMDSGGAGKGAVG